MSGQTFAEGSEETFEFRGQRFKIWRTHDLSGRRVQRYWHFDTGKHRSPEAGCRSREDAIWNAKRYINMESEGMDFDVWSWMAETMGDNSFYDEGDRYQYVRAVPYKSAEATQSERNKRVKDRLRLVTVANGYTPAEVETAQAKLATLNE